LAKDDGQRSGLRDASLLGARDHLLRGIAGDDRYTVLGEEKGVLAGAAVDFQDVVAGMKGFLQDLPDGIALSAADEGVRELVVVAGSQTVEDGSGSMNSG
jgi:hypothetical protein